MQNTEMKKEGEGELVIRELLRDLTDAQIAIVRDSCREQSQNDDLPDADLPSFQLLLHLAVAPKAIFFQRLHRHFRIAFIL